MNRNIPSAIDCFKAIVNPRFIEICDSSFRNASTTNADVLVGYPIGCQLGFNVVGDDVWRIMIGFSLILVSGIWVWFVYGYLFLVGEGSPEHILMVVPFD